MVVSDLCSNISGSVLSFFSMSCSGLSIAKNVSFSRFPGR
jgi:hypothetical protein